VGWLRSKRSDPATFLALSNQERLLLLEAMVLLPVVELSLRRTSYDRTRARLARLAGRDRRAPDPAVLVPSAVQMVAAAASRTPVAAKCLARSLTLWFLLRRRGCDAEVVIGVRPGGEPLDAHAWVERAGIPVNETQETVDSYARLLPGQSA
jgi:hypothetical protein